MNILENAKQKMIAVEKLNIAGGANSARNLQVITMRRELREPTIFRDEEAEIKELTNNSPPKLTPA